MREVAELDLRTQLCMYNNKVRDNDEDKEGVCDIVLGRKCDKPELLYLASMLQRKKQYTFSNAFITPNPA
jgi:hypothetical protein